MAKRRSQVWGEAAREQQERLVPQAPVANDVPATPPRGRCECGGEKFTLQFVDRKLQRKCRACGRTINV